MSLPKPIKRQPLHMSLDVLKEDFEDVIGYKFATLVTEDLAYSIEFNVKPEPEAFQSTSPIWEVDLIDFNTPDAILTTYASAMTPVVHYWYNFVEKTFPGGSMRNAIKKVACDQLLFAPIGMGLFLTVTTLMEGKSFDDAKQKLKKDYIRGMKANYMVWPATNFINFKCVPLEQRILFAAVISLGWNVYVATLKHS